MANINFGLLDTQYPEKLANAFVRTPEQQNANMLQVMQMQQLMDQREQAQYALGKSRREETGLLEFGNAIKALGPDPSPLAIAQVFMQHPDANMKLKGFELQKQAQDSDRYARANAPAPGPAFGGAAPAVSAPESFGAEVATRKAELFGPPPGRTNMMPGAAAALGEVNNLPAAFTPPQVKTQLDSLLARRDANLALGTPRGDKTAETLQKQITDLTKLYPLGNVLMSGTGAVVGTAPEATPQEIRTMQALGYPNTQAGYTAFRDAQRPDRLLTPAEKQQKIDIALASRPLAQPVAPTITTVEDPTRPGKFLQVDARQYLGGGAGSPGVIGGARPSATTEKIAAQRTQLGKDLGFAITQLTDITKDGGLIDQSTGSGAGRLTDIGAGFFGAATPGAIAIGKIAPIADLALKVVPRFEGPQSNADTKSYKEAAGQLADSSLPTKIRKEAGKVVLRIMQARKDQFVTNDMAAEGATSGSGIVDFGSLK